MYQAEVRSKRTRAALTGGVIGTVVLVAVYLGFVVAATRGGVE